MTDKFTQQQYEIMEKYLDDTGYGTYETWADDSGYTNHYEADYPERQWMDEHGNYVDIELQLWFAIEAAQEVTEEAKIGV